MRQGEYDMKIRNRQELLLLLNDPHLLVKPLALGAMAVAAAIIANAQVATFIAGINMAAQGCSSTMHKMFIASKSSQRHLLG